MRGKFQNQTKIEQVLCAILKLSTLCFFWKKKKKSIGIKQIVWETQK